MRSPRALLIWLLSLGVVCARPAYADAVDPAGARELLKLGYALKQEGKYAEALERLTESLRLDAQLKTLINVADCEEHLGQLTRAEQHWMLAQEQATQQGAAQFSEEVEKRLAALEARMPRLALSLSEPGVEGTEVTRDGVLLGAAAIGVALPTDPGAHEIVVTAPGRSEGRYRVELRERDSRLLSVAPGPAVEAPTPLPEATPARPRERLPEAPRPTAASATPRAGFWSTQRVLAVGAGGLGLVGFGAAGVAWARANSQHGDALATCKPDCTDLGRQFQADAVRNAHLSTALLVSGSVLVAGGAVLWLVAPASRESTSLALVPVASDAVSGVAATGRF